MENNEGMEELREALDSLVEHGFIVEGINPETGETTYKVTEKGREEAEKIMAKVNALEEDENDDSFWFNK